MKRTIHAVTGAFGYSGRYITKRLLLRQDCRIITLTNSMGRGNPFGDQVQAFPLSFDEAKLERVLRGVDVLYNTYWVRFNHRNFTHAKAVENTMVLFEAARRAGVRRVVHVSITNPSETSPLEYFSGKARIERALQESGMSYAILRPTVLFGLEDILINNIAWALRRFPVFAVFGNGKYQLQPIFVGDLADLAVEQGGSAENVVINAIGPETFSYEGLIKTVGKAINKPRHIIHVSPDLGYALSRVIGLLMKDIFVTREEIRGLMDGLLCVTTKPVGKTQLTEWLREHAAELGQSYASELGRRRKRRPS